MAGAGREELESLAVVLGEADGCCREGDTKLKLASGGVGPLRQHAVQELTQLVHAPGIKRRGIGMHKDEWVPAVREGVGQHVD